jgi:hypothetical protein
MTNEELYQKTLEAVKELFGDQTVDQDMTRSNLEALRDEIDLMITSLE